MFPSLAAEVVYRDTPGAAEWIASAKVVLDGLRAGTIPASRVQGDGSEKGYAAAFWNERTITDLDKADYASIVVPSRAVKLAFPPPRKGAISTIPTEKDCANWLQSEFALDPGHKRSKSSFRDAALEMFPTGLSGRGFERAWGTVAGQAGRCAPGRKS